MLLDFFENQLRRMFASLNYCIYSVIEWILQGIFDIASLNLNTGLIQEIYMRIYVLLGIFMTFKIMVSLLKYLVNPDVMMDKEKGAAKFVTRVITMLALLIFLPNVFPLLYDVQREFIPMLPKIILGQANDNSDTVTDNANVLAVSALSAFFRPCDSCDPADRPAEIQSIDDMMNRVVDKKNGVYQYDFNYVFALITGAVIVFILISMTIKVGIRLFKMFLLEMIAPIPIMSYIDPKSSKDGAFAAWVKQLTSTFLDLFIRLGIIYLVLVVLSNLANGTLITGMPSGLRGTYVTVFLIIALLMFAKDAPNFIKDALGIKHDKDTSGALAAATGFVSGGVTGAVSGAISGRGLRGAITGAATGASAGWQGGMTGKKASAWSAAGDAAIQARTGDSKAKSGVFAFLQKSSSNAQLRSQARKIGLTHDSLEDAKANMLEMQANAAEAQRLWDYGVSTGHFEDFNGNAITMSEAADLVAKTSEAASIAAKNYEKGNKAGDIYGINPDFARGLKQDKKDAKVDFQRGRITKDQYKAKGRYNSKKGSFNPRIP